MQDTHTHEVQIRSISFKRITDLAMKMTIAYKFRVNGPYLTNKPQLLTLFLLLYSTASIWIRA